MAFDWLKLLTEFKTDQTNRSDWYYRNVASPEGLITVAENQFI